jgi:aspartate/methionine/tyrosine aminotransferase
VANIQQWVNFSSPTPNQDAIALSLIQAREPYNNFDSYYDSLAAEYLRKRDILVDALSFAGITPIVPAGSFFILGETSHLSTIIPDMYLKQVTKAMPSTNPIPLDWAMSRWMTAEVGVCSIPPSAFYSPDTLHLAANTLRFAFCKRDETLLEARERFLKFFG